MGPQLRRELTKWTKEVSEKEVVTQEISSYLSGLWLKIYENREVLGIKDMSYFSKIQFEILDQVDPNNREYI